MSRKQNLALRLLNDPQLVDLLFGAGAGGGKSYLVCLWMVLQCRDYPGIRIGLGRKEITKLKQTTVITLLREIHPALGILQSEFTYSDHKAIVQYINGSAILLVDLAPAPSDPNFDAFGSLNFTHCVAEEIGEVTQKARNAFFSRNNRFLNKEYKIVGKTVSTCNPSQNYAKQEYYVPFVNLGGGEFQKWEHGKVEVNGEKKQAYRAFIPSFATENPFIDSNYIEGLRRLPPPERKRLLEGDWNFSDDDTMLFKGVLLDRAIKKEIEPGDRFIGVDVADTGKDRTIFSLIEGKMLVEQIEVQVDKTEAIGEQIAKKLIEYAEKNGIPKEKASRIGVDVLGVGASTRDFMRSNGWYVSEFVAGSKAISEGYRNLRAEALYTLSQKMDKGEFFIYSDLATLTKLRDQLMAFEYSTEERIIMIKSKKLIKEVLGVSPDHAESAYIGFWVACGNIDPMNNPNRIRF